MSWQRQAWNMSLKQGSLIGANSWTKPVICFESHARDFFSVSFIRNWVAEIPHLLHLKPETHSFFWKVEVLLLEIFLKIQIFKRPAELNVRLKLILNPQWPATNPDFAIHKTLMTVCNVQWASIILAFFDMTDRSKLLRLGQNNRL